MMIADYWNKWYQIKDTAFLKYLSRNIMFKNHFETIYTGISP